MAFQRSVLQMGVLLLAVMAFTGGYTYLRNAVTLGNPIFPAPVRVFGNEILPGWGGATRLTRLVGARAALDLLLTGRPVPAREAKQFGLIDHAFCVRRAKIELRTFLDRLFTIALHQLVKARRRAKRDTVLGLLDVEDHQPADERAGASFARALIAADR